MKKQNLENKTLIVTGASSGIGYEIAKYLGVSQVQVSRLENKIIDKKIMKH